MKIQTTTQKQTKKKIKKNRKKKIIIIKYKVYLIRIVCQCRVFEC